MKIASFKFDRDQWPPKLYVSIHGAPHRRQEVEILEQYREKLYEMGLFYGIAPFSDILDVDILFVDPTTPDLDNLITAFYRAVDGKALSGPSLLTDDGLIQKVTMAKYYPNGPTKYENRVP